MFLTPHII